MTLIGLSNYEIISAILVIVLITLILVARAAVLRARHRETETNLSRHQLVAKLSSRGLASLIAQALVDSHLLAQDKFDEATKVAERKIDLRKALGDY